MRSPRPGDNSLPGPIVEVAGIDGSGKSTLASHLCGHIIARGHKAYVRSFHSWVRRWSTARADRLGLSRGEYFGVDAVEFATALELTDRASMLGQAVGDGSAYILDPYTFCSAAMSASYGATNLRAIVDTYVGAQEPDLIVYLNIDEEAALDRIQRRSSSDNVLLPSREEPSLGRFRSGLEQVLPMFVERGSHVLTLDGRDSVDSHLKNVLTELSELGWSV